MWKPIYKSIYLGTTILDLGKVLMQHFHYNYIKNKCDDKAEMFQTDTDSLMFEIEAENIYEVFYKNKKLFCFNNYLEDSKNSNNLVVGKTKDETCSVPIKGFVGLKSKIYAFITKDKYESKKVKCINKNVLDNELKYENYKNALLGRSYMRHEINKIQSKYHRVGLHIINKLFFGFLL